MKTFLSLLFLTLYIAAHGQLNDAFAYSNSTLLDTNNSQYNDVDGTPYHVDEDFTKGFIVREGKTIPNIDLRYNAYKDRVEIMVKEDEIYEANTNIDYEYIIRGENFVRVSFLDDKKITSGFMVCLSCTGNTKVYKRYYKIFQEAKEGKTGYHNSTPRRFLSEDQIYIVSNKNKNAVALETSGKKILQQFAPITPEMTNFIKSEKLKLKKEEDLVRFVEFLNNNNL